MEYFSRKHQKCGTEAAYLTCIIFRRGERTALPCKEVMEEKNMKKATIRDVAKAAGVSQSTVSRVLNNHPDVSEKARKTIMAVVEKHHFKLNSNAKHLKQQAYEGLALVVKGTQNALFADLLDKLQAYVEKCGYTPTVYYINETGDEMAYAQMLCTERKPYGIFFIGSHPHCFTPELAGLGIPCVLLTNNAASLGIPNLSSVSVDDRAAAKVMIEYMYKQGRRRIGIIGDRPDCSRPSQQRLDGCLEAMQQLGLPFDFDKQYGYARFSLEESYAAAEYLLAHCPDLDAVFAMSDLMALGAVRAFQDHGLRVPQDFGVAGFAGAVHRAAADDHPPEHRAALPACRADFACQHRA